MPSRGFRTTSAILLTRPLGARFAFSCLRWAVFFAGKADRQSELGAVRLEWGDISE